MAYNINDLISPTGNTNYFRFLTLLYLVLKGNSLSHLEGLFISFGCRCFIIFNVGSLVLKEIIFSL